MEDVVPSAVLQKNSKYARVFLLHAIFMNTKRMGSYFDADWKALETIPKVKIVTQLSWGELTDINVPQVLDIFESAKTTLTTLWLHDINIETQKMYDLLSILPRLTSLKLTSRSSEAPMKSEYSFNSTFPIRSLRTNLPHVDELYFRQLLTCSPDLEHLILRKDAAFVGTLLKENIQILSPSRALDLVRQLCPKILRVKVECEGAPKSVNYNCSFDATVATLGPAQDQLIQLEFAERMLEVPVIQTINRSAGFLESLKITLVVAKDMNLERFKELISSRKFTSLRTLHFRSKATRDEANTFSLFESEWGCSTVESFLLDGLVLRNRISLCRRLTEK